MQISAFITALALGLIFIPIIRKIGPRLGMVAAPRADRWHSEPTPKMGGIGIFLAAGVTLTIFLAVTPLGLSQWPLLLGAGIIFGIGVIDDIKRISPPAKLIGEIIAAAIVVFFGRNIDFFSLDFINIPFTFLWLVGITNAINLLDNMDGLAGGISFISAMLLSFLFWQSNTQDLLLISLAVAGGILGFLVFNFPPASIFMGDSGSLFLGFTLASLAIARVPQASDVLAVMGVPTLLFLLPILDTTLVTITRILRGQSPAQGGRDHTSHRLIAFGLSERQAVLILYGVAITAGVIGTTLESIDYTISLILIPILLITLTLLTAYLARLKVVPSESTPKSQSNFSNLMIGLTYRGRILEIAFDLLLINIAYYLAFWTHFGSAVEIFNLDVFIISLPAALAAAYISFFIFGIYRGVWQYVGLRDLFRYAKAVLGAALLTGIVVSIFITHNSVSLRIFFLFAVFLFLGLIISRSSFRILDQVYTKQTRRSNEEQPILIFGAGDHGVMLLQWLLGDSTHNFKPIGFIDNDPFKRGRQILGINVLGNIENIAEILKSFDVDGIVLANSNLINSEQKSELRSICLSHGIWFKQFRFELVSIK